jgi:[acyl-carrier-protein] S-malonyltransferase
MSKTAFLFPGQGAQHAGMGKQLAADFPAAKELYEKANDVLGFDLAQLCHEGPQEELDKTNISQPALYVSSFAALEKLKVESPETVEICSLAAGLSLGEYTALTFAGAISFEDGLRVVRKRGEAMQAASDQVESGMVSALLLDEDAVNDVAAKTNETGNRIWIANYLCPGNTVLSGDKAACETAARLIEEAGGRAIPLSVAGAFHTPIMESAVAELSEVLASIDIASPRIPVVSNVDAVPHSDPDEIRSLLVEQVQNPVLWEKSVRFLLGEGVEQFYEVGPGKVLKGLMRRIDRKTKCNVVNDS